MAETYDVSFENKDLAYYMRNRLSGYLKYRKSTCIDPGADPLHVKTHGNNHITIDSSLLTPLKKIAERHGLEFRLN